MNVIWIVLDSLSFSATPFQKDGPETMPKLSSVAADHGLSFTKAYVPGPKSPSSHGSFLTGQLPSRTGMHEANPSFNSNLPTIADALANTHDTYLITSNPFLFNGLDERFDETTFLNDRAYLPFPEATNPEEFKWRRDHSTRWERYRDFLLQGGKPVRSSINGMSYKLGGGGSSRILSTTNVDATECQTVETMNQQIRSFLDSDTDSFVLANYMDVHPPLNVSERALEEWFPNQTRSDLPTGISGDELQKVVAEDGIDEVLKLYHAAIWDLDRKITPFIQESLEDNSLVVVTADHGHWFCPDGGLNDQKIHVPLILFGQEISFGINEQTVNLIQLPETTVDVLDIDVDWKWREPSLLSEDPGSISLTEYIRAEGGGPVNPYGDDSVVCHDIVGIKESTHVKYKNGDYNLETKNEIHETVIREAIESLVSEFADHDDRSIEYDEATEERLKELGYL